MADRPTRRQPARQEGALAVPDNTSPDVSASPTKQGVQAQLALFYVKGFVIIVAGVLIVTLFTCRTIDDIKNILLAISGVLSGPLGFIIGFYFKEEVQNKENTNTQ